MALASRIAELQAAIRAADPDGAVPSWSSLPAAHQYRLLLARTDLHVAPGSAVLDWGCGRGPFSFALARGGYAVTAYSLETEPALFAALSPGERSRLTFVRGNGADPRGLPFPDASFDAVFSVGVLEHVREPGGDEVASLREIRRVLRAGGVFVCVHFPNRGSWIEALARLRWGRREAGRRESASFHRHLFSGRDIPRLCAAAGLARIGSGRYGFLPRNSFNRLPGGLRNSPFVAALVDGIDAVLERLFAPLVQNFWFVARREPDDVRGGGAPSR